MPLDKNLVCVYPLSSCTKLFFSDDFIQAQQQLARWASEDVVSVVVMDPSDSAVVGPSPVVTVQNIMPHPNSITPMAQMGNGLGATAHHDYFPSPPSTTETESSGSVMAHQGAPVRRANGPQDLTQTNTGHFPEYKHW